MYRYEYYNRNGNYWTTLRVWPAVFNIALESVMRKVLIQAKGIKMDIVDELTDLGQKFDANIGGGRMLRLFRLDCTDGPNGNWESAFSKPFLCTCSLQRITAYISVYHAHAHCMKYLGNNIFIG